MSTYSVSASQLAEGTSVFVRGKLAYARLTRPIAGDELAASDQRKVQNGMSPVGKPHTTATITQAEVQYADPSDPTVEEQFVAERRYTSKKKPETGLNYSIDSKGTNLPIIAIPAKAGDGTFDQDNTGQELAQDLDVTLVLRVYKPKNFNNRGLALDEVIVHEPPRYFNTSAVGADELAARGIVFNTPPRLSRHRWPAPPSAQSRSGQHRRRGRPVVPGSAALRGGCASAGRRPCRAPARPPSPRSRPPNRSSLVSRLRTRR